jgi:hypothetical protein
MQATATQRFRKPSAVAPRSRAKRPFQMWVLAWADTLKKYIVCSLDDESDFTVPIAWCTDSPTGS